MEQCYEQIVASFTKMNFQYYEQIVGHVNPGQIFVRNLSSRKTKEMLRDYFSRFGEVTETFVYLNEGYVVFSYPFALDLLCDQDHFIDDHKLILYGPVTRGPRFGMIEEERLGMGQTEEEVEEELQLTRELNKMKLRIEELESKVNEVPWNTNKVRFADRDEVETNAERRNVENKYISCQIFVGGLPPILTREQFKQCFERFGDVVEAKINTELGTGKPRGFGFITFYSQDDVENVLNNSVYHKLGDVSVQVKRALPKHHSRYGGNQGYHTSSANAIIGGMSGHMFPQPQHPSGYPPFPSCQPSYYYSGAVYSNDSYPTQNVQGSQNQPISSYEPPTYYYIASSSNATYQGSRNSSAYPGNQPY